MVLKCWRKFKKLGGGLEFRKVEEKGDRFIFAYHRRSLEDYPLEIVKGNRVVLRKDFSSRKESLKFAKAYMKKNDAC